MSDITNIKQAVMKQYGVRHSIDQVFQDEHILSEQALY